MKSLIIALISIAFLAACTTVEQPMTPEEKAEISTTITELFDKMTEEILALNSEGILSYYKLDENLTLITDGDITIGGDAIKKMMDEGFSYLKELLHFEYLEFHVIVLDHDLVLAMGPYDETVVTATDDTLRFKGTGSYLLQLEDTGWKISQGNITHKMAE